MSHTARTLLTLAAYPDAAAQKQAAQYAALIIAGGNYAGMLPGTAYWQNAGVQ